MNFSKSTYRKARRVLVVRAMELYELNALPEYKQALDDLEKIGNRARREKGMWL